PAVPVPAVPVPAAVAPVAPLPVSSPSAVTLTRQSIPGAAGTITAVVPAAPTMVAEAPARRRQSPEPFRVRPAPLVVLALALLGIMLHDLLVRADTNDIDPRPRIGVSFDYDLSGDPKTKSAFGNTLSFGVYKDLRSDVKHDAKQLEALIADLGKDKAEAEAATLSIERYGPWAIPALEEALDRKPPKNQHQRIEAVLKRLDPRLTFDKLGRTNSTVLKIDRLEKIFGHSAG